MARQARSIDALIARIGEMRELDQPAEVVGALVKKYLGNHDATDLLSGTFLGHPLHPALTDAVTGAFGGALILDWLVARGPRRSGDVLVLVGLAAAIPTLASGLVDWNDTYGPDRRVGLVHAALNLAGTGLFAMSLGSQLTRHRMRSRMFRLLGFSALTAGGYLGGHMTYRKGIGVDPLAATSFPSDWTALVPVDDLHEGRPAHAVADGISYVLVKRGKTVHALADVCTHAGGPLHEGTMKDGCLVCPWHGSMFDPSTGDVVHGPARAPAPVLETRVKAGKVEVRRASGG